MKKLFFIITSLALALTFSSCNKQGPASESNTEGREVSLRPYGFQTKSAVSGTAFPQGYDMLVSAYRNLGSHPGEDTAQDYFEGIQFGYSSDVAGWKSERGPKYYPLDGTLDFLAIAGAGINSSSTGIVPTSVTWGESSNVSKKFVAVLPDNSAKFDDILYGASNAQSKSSSGSPMEFKHAMTSVVFLAKCNIAYNSTTNAGITIDNITVDGAKYSGTLTVNNPAAGGGSGSLSASWSSLGSEKEHLSARVWNTANLGTNTTEAALSAFNLTSTYTSLSTSKFGDAYVIMPPQNAVPFTVTYTLHNGFAADGTTPLNKQMQFQYTPSGTWAMGKKNVYSLDFSLSEIIIKPTVVDWDAVTTEVDIPDPANGHAYVDLGLRVGGNKILFATMNVGASSPEEYGDYFAWGETSKRYTSISGTSVVGATFEWSNCPYHTGSTYNTGWSKYIPTGKESYTVSGTADNKLVLDASDDVASVLWGGSWRMPDKSDLEYLISSNVTYNWTDDYNSTGVAGLIVTGKDAFSSASLFLPAAGYCYDTDLYDAGDYGIYWSRSVISDYPSYAWYLCFEDGDQCMENYDRYLGQSVRPVLVLPE